MSKLMDMGYKMKNDHAVPTPSKPGGDNKINYPSLHLYDKVPPDLMKKEIGAKCRVEIVGKIISKGISESGQNKNENLTIEIEKMGYIGPAGKKTKEEYLNSSKEDRESYDKEDLKVDEED